MPGVINTYPKFLLSMLEAKSQGVTPGQLSDTVSGSIDMWPLYTMQREVRVNGTVGPVNAVGRHRVTTITVPEDQWWYVREHNMQATAALAAGATFTVAIGYSNQFGTVLGTLCPQNMGANIVYQANAQPMLYVPDPYWLPPGCNPATLQLLNSGASATWRHELVYTPFTF